MQTAKEKVKDTVSTAKGKVKINKAKVEEKVEKGTARSKTEKEIAHERAKAKEAEANMEMHAEKAQHREKSMARHHLRHHKPVGGPVAPAGTTINAAAPGYAGGYGMRPPENNKYL